MKLEVFRKNNKMKQSILIGGIIVFLLIAGILVYRSYAIYQEKKEFDVIRGNVPDQNYDVQLAFVVDGVATDNMPSRESGKAVESIVCDKNATGVFDEERWAVMVLNAQKSRTKCRISFQSKYQERDLNGTDPVFTDGLIPVTIHEDGSVTKSFSGSIWYDYSKKNWANAVILKDESVNYFEGEFIPEDNIEAYFVWIPRYRYKIFNEGNYNDLTSVEGKEQLIEIEFENKNEGIKNGSHIGEWLTHPAFTSLDVNGIWVGKFETSYEGANSHSDAVQNKRDESKIQIKPNQYSWMVSQISNSHLNSYNYRRNMDSHLMKNTEWGAVAYLSHSAYGSTDIRMNNNGNVVTGYAAKNEPTCGFNGNNQDCNIYENVLAGADGAHSVNYFNELSNLASTTNNKSGIYDMSGGTWEAVMAAVTSNNVPLAGRSIAGGYSGFNGPFGCPSCDVTDGNNVISFQDGIDYPESKYYDTYEVEWIHTAYDQRILGDATGEMGPFAQTNLEGNNMAFGSWHSALAFFPYAGNPFMLRGGAYTDGINSGIFAFFRYSGDNELSSYRIVLAF